MSCKICGRSACTQSFHSLDEQALFEQRETMPDDVALLRRMVQEAAAEILQLKADIITLENNYSVSGEAEALSQTMVREGAAEILWLKAALRCAGDALDKMGNELAAQSAYDASKH